MSDPYRDAPATKRAEARGLRRAAALVLVLTIPSFVIGYRLGLFGEGGTVLPMVFGVPGLLGCLAAANVSGDSDEDKFWRSFGRQASAALTAGLLGVVLGSWP